MMLVRLAAPFFALFLLLAAPPAVTAQNLPPEVQFDLLVQKLASEIKNERWNSALATVEELRDSNTDLPDSFLHFEAQANLNAGNPNAAEQAWIAYVSATGRQGKYYTEALAGIIEAQQSDSYVQMAEGEFMDCGGCPIMVPLNPGVGALIKDDRKTSSFADGLDERTIRKINIEYAFAISKFEVTYAQYKRFIEETGYQSSSNCTVYVSGDKHNVNSKSIPGRSWRNAYGTVFNNQPVGCVNWHDAKAYTAWLSEKTGHIYRLPTYVEWEYATRAGTDSTWFCGNNPDCLDSVAWHRGNYSKFSAPAVGTKNPNPWGLHDTLGSVWEWVEDCYVGFDKFPTDGSAYSAEPECRRIIRGAGIINPLVKMPISRVFDFNPIGNNWIVGIRVVRELR